MQHEASDPLRSTAKEALLAKCRARTAVSIPEASAAWNIGANLGYELAARGEFPCRVVRLGRKLLVPTADLLMSLGLHDEARELAEVTDTGTDASARPAIL
jgi:hypothetical protein